MYCVYMIQVCVYKREWRFFLEQKRDGRNENIAGEIDQGINTKRKG